MVLGLMLFAWANAWAGPCLMSMDTGKPAVADHAHGAPANHAAPGHAQNEVPPPECDHCPPGAGHVAEQCAAGMRADCGAVPDQGTEFRKAELKFKDVIATPALPGHTTGTVRGPTGPGEPPISPGQLKWRSAPLLFLDHCVFLK